MTREQQIEELLTRGVEHVYPDRETLREALLGNKKLRVKFGMDPTKPDLHLGHAVPLRKLRQFQDLGHTVILLIGDFTARIGDPTGRNETRPMMSEEEIKENMKTYVAQAGKILDIAKTEVRYNSEWLDEMNFADVYRLASRVTFAQVAQRADFKKRLQNDVDISLPEFMYPLMQGYDSVALKADVEIGGTDQTFNLLMGRQIQKRYDMKQQSVLTTPLLEGLDGKEKMSKSLDNYIGLTDSPDEMYGKAMSIPDTLIVKYFELCTAVSPEDVISVHAELERGVRNPMEYKMRLAREIVTLYHDQSAALQAEENFKNVFQEDEIPRDIPEYRADGGRSHKLTDLLFDSGLVQTKSEGRRMIEQGGVKIDGAKVSDINAEITPKDRMVIQIGKRRFVRIFTA